MGKLTAEKFVAFSTLLQQCSLLDANLFSGELRDRLWRVEEVITTLDEALRAEYQKLLATIDNSARYSPEAIALFREILEQDDVNNLTGRDKVLLVLAESRTVSVNTYLSKEEIAARAGVSPNSVSTCILLLKNLVKPSYLIVNERGEGWRLYKRGEIVQ